MLNVKNGNLIINIGIEILVNVQKFFECYFYYFFKECVVLFLTLFLLYKGSFGLGNSITVQRYISTLMISKKKGFT